MNELECLFSLQPSKKLFPPQHNAHNTCAYASLTCSGFNFFSPFYPPAPPFQSFSIFHHVISKSHATPFPVNVELFLLLHSFAYTMVFSWGAWNTQKSHKKLCRCVVVVCLPRAKNENVKLTRNAWMYVRWLWRNYILIYETLLLLSKILELFYFHFAFSSANSQWERERERAKPH